MGMDVYGETGAYFRNNWWSWHPLADYVIEVAPDIAGQCRYWHTNDGDGLSKANALSLADRLQAEIDAGRTAHYEIIYRSEQEKLPNKPCPLCKGTSTRKPAPQAGAGDPKTDGVPCNYCDNTGYVPAQTCAYRFSVDNVRSFVDFLRECGGFRIY
jgi:hypothetical protein